MDKRHSGAGPDDVMSFGEDDSPQSRRWLPMGAALVGIAVGFLAGINTDVAGVKTASAGTSSPAAPLAAGPVEDLASDRDDVTFQLRVHNAAAEQVTVNMLRVGDWEPDVSSTARISPGSWGLVEFSAPVDCSVPLGDSDSVRLRGRTTADVFEQTLPIAAGAENLAEHYQAVCGDTSPVTTADLSGVWLIEEVHGQDQMLVGTNMMRFEPDGRWVVDAYGELFGDDKALWGTYRLDGRFLETHPEGGHWGCDPGAVARWRVSITPDDRLLMALEPGSTCPDGEWDVWIARRVLLDEGLPPPLAGVAPTSR